MADRPNTTNTLHELMNQLKPNLWAVLPSPIGAEPYFATYCPKTHAVVSKGVVIPNQSRADAIEALVNGADDPFDAQPWSKTAETALPTRPWDACRYFAYSRYANGRFNPTATNLISRSEFYGTTVILLE